MAYLSLNRNVRGSLATDSKGSSRYALVGYPIQSKRSDRMLVRANGSDEGLMDSSDAYANHLPPLPIGRTLRLVQGGARVINIPIPKLAWKRMLMPVSGSNLDAFSLLRWPQILGADFEKLCGQAEAFEASKEPANAQYTSGYRLEPSKLLN